MKLSIAVGIPAAVAKDASTDFAPDQLVQTEGKDLVFTFSVTGKEEIKRVEGLLEAHDYKLLGAKSIQLRDR